MVLQAPLAAFLRAASLCELEPHLQQYHNDTDCLNTDCLVSVAVMLRYVNLPAPSIVVLLCCRPLLEPLMTHYTRCMLYAEAQTTGQRSPIRYCP